MDFEQKVMRLVQDNKRLLQQGSAYEFAQKMKLLSHRKSQSHKLEQAQTIMRLALAEVVNYPSVEINIINDLLNSLISMYQQHKELFCHRIADHLQIFFDKRDIPIRYEVYARLLRGVVKKEDYPLIVEKLVTHLEEKCMFAQAEAYIIEGPLHRYIELLMRWKSKISAKEFCAVACRAALLRGLFVDLDEFRAFMIPLESEDPYFRYASVLKRAVEFKSKEAYYKIGKCYEGFLARDVVYKKIYEMYGKKFFGIETSKKGLIGMLE